MLSPLMLFFISLSKYIRMHKYMPIDHQTLAAKWIHPWRTKQIVLFSTQCNKAFWPVWTWCSLNGSQPMTNALLQVFAPQYVYHRYYYVCWHGIKTRHGNMKSAYVFSTSFSWAGPHPMKHKGKAYKALSILFHWDGIPPVVVCNDSKEQHKSNFAWNIKYQRGRLPQPTDWTLVLHVATSCWGMYPQVEMQCWF